MGKINGVLKCVFIFFNVMGAIFACLMIYGTMKASSYGQQMSAIQGPSLVWSWVFSIGVLVTSSLGIYAGCSEKVIALKVFAGFMVVGMILMLIFGIITVVTKNKLKAAFEDSDSEVVKVLMQDKQMRDVLEQLQEAAECCGLASAKDWGDTIPVSCSCRRYIYGGSRCTSKPVGTSGPAEIYKKPCNEIILQYTDVLFRVAMGIYFGFAVIMLLGLLVSIVMVRQVLGNNAGGPSIMMKGY